MEFIFIFIIVVVDVAVVSQSFKKNYVTVINLKEIKSSMLLIDCRPKLFFLYIVILMYFKSMTIVHH